MITIIAGTNREGSNSKKIALEYSNFLTEKNATHKLLALDEHVVFERNEAFVAMEKEYLLDADKIIFIVPEYNGSYPGVLKMLIDNSDVKTTWPNKKILLTGVSTGRAGNLRGLDHLTGALLYLKANVHYNRLPISSVHTLLDKNGNLVDESTQLTIGNQLNEFLLF